MWALEPVYYPNFLEFVALILRGHEKGSNGIVAFELHLDPHVVAAPSELLPKSFCVGHHYGKIAKSFCVGYHYGKFSIVVPYTKGLQTGKEQLISRGTEPKK